MSASCLPRICSSTSRTSSAIRPRSIFWQRQIVPELVREQTLDRPLRVWVPGCSTGEEAYSIAMLFLEQIAAAKRNIKLQVFASDIDADCVAFARNGIYPESIEADVTPARLARFFTKEDHTIRSCANCVRRWCSPRQSLLADAPFSRIDLISCRNLLIYLSPEAQGKDSVALPLRAARGRRAVSGVLRNSRQRVRIASSRSARSTGFIGISVAAGRARSNFRVGSNAAGRLMQTPGTARRCRGGSASASYRSERMLDAYAPASVLINAKHEGLYFFGSTDRYLKVASGEGTPGRARHGARGIARQAQVGDPARQTGSGARVTVTGAQARARRSIGQRKYHRPAS